MRKATFGEKWPYKLIVEVKGYRGEYVKLKKATIQAYRVPGVSDLTSFGRWASAGFTVVYEMHQDFQKLIDTLANTEAA